MLNRKINLEGTNNTRDIGGLQTTTGITTNFGAYFRSDSIARLTPLDVDFLLEKNLETIVDMRSRDELCNTELKALNDKSIHYHWIPIELNSKCERNLCLSKIYINLLETQKAALCEVFNILANAKGLCLYNCNGGKDRTGIVSMLVLDIANVKMDFIIGDYMETEANMKLIFAEVSKRIEQKKCNIPIGGLQCAPQFVSDTLGYIRQRYTSSRNYLNNIGVTNDAINMILKRLLPN